MKKKIVGFRELTSRDFDVMNKTLSKQGGLIQQINGNLKVVTEACSRRLHESKDVHPRTADKLQLSDTVVVVGDNEHRDSVGHIVALTPDKKTVTVKLYNSGTAQTFDSKDVEEYLDDEDEDEPSEFYVAFYDEDSEESWIGRIVKSDTKWHEEKYAGEPDYHFHGAYMGYLTPDEIMNWIHKDYDRGFEIKGPFDTGEEAKKFVEREWGKLRESTCTEDDHEYEAPDLIDILQQTKNHLPKLMSKEDSEEVRTIITALSNKVHDGHGFINELAKWEKADPSMLDIIKIDIAAGAGLPDFKSVLKMYFGLSENMMARLNKQVAHLGKPFNLIEVHEAAKYVDFAVADLLASQFGKKRFWALNIAQMESIVNAYPFILAEGAKNDFRKMVLATLHEHEHFLKHIAEEELGGCTVEKIAPYGEIVDNPNFARSHPIQIAIHAICHDAPRRNGKQLDLTKKLNKRLLMHPLPKIGEIQAVVFHTESEKRDLGESVLKEYEKFTDENGVTWNDEGDSDHGHSNWGRSSRKYSGRAYQAKPAANGRFYHSVAFKEKEDAKREGMRFDPVKKQWYHTDKAKSLISKFPPLSEEG